MCTYIYELSHTHMHRHIDTHTHIYDIYTHALPNIHTNITHIDTHGTYTPHRYTVHRKHHRHIYTHVPLTQICTYVHLVYAGRTRTYTINTQIHT